ncbi:MAG: hypothetical protein NZ929_06165 [Aigarchaeota archaeon]|nr:hypothetical protein [Aigarchaeota archaeon]MCX8192567.1 hypothetical protein [Nitrososphaeria archaeon]MDW7985697.1 hypothetical protein [Nitrososphaerota archaeon]
MNKHGLAISKKISIIALFSIVVFISKIFLPTPLDKMFILIQPLSYAMANFIIGRLGGTVVGAISGLLVQTWRPVFIPFTFLFALIYGLMIDFFIYLFRIRSSQRTVSSLRLMFALSLASIIVGVSAMYVTVGAGVMPAAYQIYIMVLIAGTLNGLVAGYLIAQIWNRYLGKRIT